MNQTWIWIIRSTKKKRLGNDSETENEGIHVVFVAEQKKDIRANDYNSEFLNLNVSGMFLWIL